MLKFKFLYCATLLVFVELTMSLVPNVTNVHDINLRRNAKRHKKERSTSSSEQDKNSGNALVDKESLDLSSHTTSSRESEGFNKPLSSVERSGWRKWHRKCPTCNEDMIKKWKDPSIKWICGRYQRAQRSFKSECMMHYRNCQDGTMFQKIADHRCTTEIGRDQPQGINFFYDYKVQISDQSADSLSTETSGSASSND